MRSGTEIVSTSKLLNGGGDIFGYAAKKTNRITTMGLQIVWVCISPSLPQPWNTGCNPATGNCSLNSQSPTS
ncbi:hypothetical protein SAMN05216288_3908 [Pseudomonas punonensis]|uniref:Uncharacterized protein n=1 Tax=Phytopseudomonas punonensis TaxID=1220495 RepID=A0A1M7K096_9GAMM|nr:hypothetical protein SAMN05216288_3908 [Pseudomonas punonensis]